MNYRSGARSLSMRVGRERIEIEGEAKKVRKMEAVRKTHLGM